MINELQIFTNEQFGEVRSIMKDGQPWFVSVDVCKALEIGNPSQAISRLDEDEHFTTLISNESAASGKSNASFVNEAGLYTLVLGSRKPEAKAFKRWITHEVIPTIRKHGAYMTDDTLKEALTSPDFLIQLATQLKEEKEARRALEAENKVQAQQIAEFQPKASYYDVILNCPDLMSVSKIAKDYGKSAVWLNAKLHELGVQYKQGDIWLLYQKYAEMGYTSTKTHVVNGTDGLPHSKVNTAWTQRGRLFIYDLLKSHGILPLIESNATA